MISFRSRRSAPLPAPGPDSSGARTRLRRPAVWGGCVLALLLTGCGTGGAVPVDMAPDGDNPDCAKAMVAMPEEVSGEKQRDTTAQGTTAWGDDVILKCGVHVKEPVMDPCVNVNGVDWILAKADESASGSARPSQSSSSASSAPPSGGKTSAAKKTAAQDVQASSGTWQATTYGRSPAVQVTFDADHVPSSSLLVELQSAVHQIPQKKKCASVADTLDDNQ